MKFFAAALFAAVVSADSDFLGHVAEFGLSYGTIEEYNFRLSNFKALDIKIQEHNAGKHNYTLGHNKMSTWTHNEYKRLMGRAKNGAKPVVVHDRLNGVKAPASIDWRTQGAVTPVKDQGQCGSCWAFSTTGCLEGDWKIKGNTLTSFSEQQLLDCDYKLLKNKACNGGLPTWAYDYYMNGAAQAMTESDYPYTAARGTCSYNKAKATALITVAQGAPTSNDYASMQAAAAIQPLSVGVDAEGFRFQAYKSGVFDGSCGTSLDHATLVVGYGTDATTGQDFWIMKNSWGSSWGDQGYMRLVQNGNGPGQCGIQNDATWATVGSA